MHLYTLGVGESIRLGDGPGAVTLTVVRVGAVQVRLGVTGPRDVPVYRADAPHEVPPPHADPDPDQEAD